MAGRFGEDVALRLGGAAMLAMAAGAVSWLMRLVRAEADHAPGAGEFALAAVAVLGLTGGAMLLVLGRYVRARIVVAERWRQAGRPMVLPPREG